MKKILLTLTLAFAFFGAQAQCTPDPQFTLAGIYPDSSVGLPNAIVGQAYNEVITIIVSLDTLVDNPIIPGATISVDIIDIRLDNVNGLPANFSYDCAAPNCIFLGGSTTCAVLYSTINPTAADVGLYQIFMYTTATVDAGLFGIQTQNDIIDYYYIEVTDNTTSTMNQFDAFTFQMKDIFPNPVNDQSKIQFITGESKDVVFSLFNYLGEKMDEQIITASRGVNDILINANNYPNGMYLYSINNGGKIISKRMVIAN
jgi:hypothetical protein